MHAGNGLERGAARLVRCVLTWSSVVIRGHQRSSGLISAARLVRCVLSVLSQSRLPICLLLRCNLVASSVHLLMTALPTGFVIVRRLPLRRPFRRTQTYSDAIQSQSSRNQAAIKPQSSRPQVAIKSQSSRNQWSSVSLTCAAARLLSLTDSSWAVSSGSWLLNRASRAAARAAAAACVFSSVSCSRRSCGEERGHQHWSSVVISGHQCAHQRRS